MDKISRRNFLKFIGFSSVMIFLADFIDMRFLETLLTRSEATAGHDKKVRYGMVIDAGACIGCRQCAYACKEGNNVPDKPIPMAWIEVFELDTTNPVSEVHSVPPSESTTTYIQSPKEGKWYLSLNCFHCENPPCVKVCPVGATYIGEDGIVEMDYDKCIGCRNCMAACPYNARRFNWAEPEMPPEKINPEVPIRPRGVVEKCTFCMHRVREGKLPYCVEVCPVEARRFGDLNDPESPVSRILHSDISFRLLDEMNTQPMLYYITSGKKWLPGG